jgi:hypothetical protein
VGLYTLLRLGVVVVRTTVRLDRSARHQLAAIVHMDGHQLGAVGLGEDPGELGGVALRVQLQEAVEQDGAPRGHEPDDAVR